ncbi:DUF11 domain-containing protein [Methanobrevibacter filiformis]|uniref:DUF11 domain-containing protein n=1 Tax=Methanobrevibacter filiformis TaxID=55758 RepID=UPI000835B295|nr:DUF11 domain-containing protein [Methanobrevibacter filiformis]
MKINHYNYNNVNNLNDYSNDKDTHSKFSNLTEKSITVSENHEDNIFKCFMVSLMNIMLILLSSIPRELKKTIINNITDVNTSKLNFNKITIILSLIAILFITISSVSAADVTISTTNATGINGAVALTTATGTNHTITLNPGTYNKTTDIRSNITTSRNITIQGNGTRNLIIIDARKLGNIFNITGTRSNITFKNLTFINSDDTIHSSNSTITIINCNFTNNNNDGFGGVIYNVNGSNCSVINSSFTNNNNIGLSGLSGVIHNVNGSNFSVINSSFTNNNETIHSYNSTITIINCNFTNNTVTYNHGGGAIYNNASNCSVNNSSFTGNNARIGGGAIHNNAGNCSVSNSSFNDNNDISLGGAISNTGGGNFSVSNSSFNDNNVLIMGGGGAIYNSGNFNVSNSSFTNNNAITIGSRGGAIYNNAGGNFSVSNSTFTSNNANQSGGAIYSVDGNFSVSNSTFTGNNASSGGAISGGGNVSDSIFTGNNASSGGAISGGGNVSDSIFTGNNASSGGAISGGGNVINSTFTSNNASYYGGAISGGGNVSDSIFTGNNASSGGAIYKSDNSNYSVINSNFTGNNASSNGSAIYIGSTANVNFNVSDSIFTGNNANGSGGAIYINNKYYNANFTVNDSKFFNNTLVAIYTLNNRTFINNNLFSGNVVVLGIGFNDSTINLNSYLMSNNTIINNDIILLVDGSGNNISNGSIIGNNNSRGIFVNGHNNTFSNITIANLKVGFTFNTTNSGNILSNATFYGNEIGISMLGSNDTVMSSTIINNTIIGINITGDNNIVQYNRIYNNTLGLNNSGTNLNANFNWWGLNDITGQYANSGANFNLTYWYVLELSLNNTFYTTTNDTRNYSKNQNANLSYNLSLNIPVTNTPNLLPYFEVSILIKNSTTIVNNLTGDIRNTSLIQSVAINNPNTEYSINALSDNENLILTIVAETINYTVNVSVLKVANVSGDVHVGDNVTYTITVTNNEILNNATGVFVEDLINYNKVQYLNSNTNKGTYNYGTGIWDIGTLETGETVTLTVNVTITGTGIINNTAIVATDENNTNNNTTSSVILNITDVNVSIIKIANTTATQYIGDSITYTITVNNNATSNATGVYVIDNLDYTKLKFNSVNPSTGTYNNTTGIWTIGNLNQGQTATLTINVTIINNGTIKNTANITTDQKNIAINGSNWTFQAFSGQDVYVNATGGLDSNSGADWTDALQSIERALEIVQNNGTIHIAGNNYNNSNGIERNNTNLTINKNITLLGYTVLSGEVIIDALNNGRIFLINNGLNVTLINLTFANGNLTGTNNNGGAIYNNASKITITGSKFINNTAEIGGAIYNNNGTISLISENTSFINNTAISGGGAIYASANNNVTFINCIFSNNNVTNTTGNVAGGAIYSNGNLNIINSTFTNNSVNINTLILSTDSEAYGGAIYNYGSNFIITNSTFTDNKANSYSSSYYAYSCGGAIYNNGSNFIITNSTFTNNEANSQSSSYSSYSYGGTIYNTGVNFTINNSTFTNNNVISASNYLRGDGGAIYNMNASNFTVVNSSFLYNNGIFGGAIYNWNTNWSVSNSSFIGNNGSSDGAIYNVYGNLNVSNSSFIGNNGSSGGAIDNVGGNLSVSNSSFINNTATSSGGAIDNSFGNLNVSNSSFIGNNGSSGGAIYNGANLSVSNSSFAGNNAGYGGAIYNGNGNFSVSNSSFIGNNGSFGGAIYNGDNFSVSNSSFIGNNGSWSGAIYNSYGNFSVSNSSFSGNNGSSSGAIYNGANLSVINSTFTNNNDSYRGAIYNGANLSVGNSSFIGNNGSSSGAIYNGGNLSVGNSSFIGNNGSSGGAIYNGGNLSVGNSSFIGNDASFGGAIYNGGNLSVGNSSFIGNNASSGGVIYNNANLTVNTSVFSNNTHMAIYARNNQTFINNNSFDGNNGVLGIGFSNSIINLNSYLLSNNTIINNDIVLLVDGSRNNISNGSINGNNNSRGIFVNGHNNTFSNITIANLKVGLTFNTTNSGNILTNATIRSNEIGILILGSNDTVMSSTIINNTIIGINVTGNSNIVKYNRIYNNTLGLNNSGNNTNVNFNWWGLNNITAQYTNSGADFDLTYWYVLELSLNNTFYTTANDTRNYSKNQSANLSYNLSLNIPVTNTPNLLPYFEVTVLIKNSTSVVNNLTGDIRNTSLSRSVVINSPNTQYSINALSDRENLILTIVGEAIDYTVNVSVLKVANVSGGIHVGDNVTYTITVTNHGTLNNATGAFVEDLINYNKVQYLNSNTNKGTYNYGTGIWEIGTLETGETVTLTVNVTITGTGILNNTAIVAADENNTNNNTTSTVILNITDVNVSIIKIANTTATQYIGDNITYTITVNNNATSNATGVYVIDNLDYTKLKFNSANPSTGTYNNTTGIWTIGNLNQGQTATLTINVTIINTGTIKNTANITTDQKNIAINGSSYTFQAFNGQNVYVNATGGLDNNTGENWTDALQSIQRALEIVQNNGTIHIAGNNYNNSNGIVRNNTNLTINKNITLLGYTILSGEVIINALNNGRIFNITSGLNVSFINITFANGNLIETRTNGSGLYISTNGVISIINSKFINNRASNNDGASNTGGAIYNNGSNLRVINSTFTSNSVCAIDNHYGSNLRVINSTFTSNSGSAIYNNGSNLSVINSTFTGNTASSGSAILNLGSNFSVINSTFTGNTAINYGSAIYNEGSNFSVINSTFTGNNVSTMGVATIYNSGSNFSVINSTFTGNNGAIANGGSNFSVINSTFTGNNARNNGGAIYNLNSVVNFSVINSTFTGNTASNNGGAICNSGVNFSVINSTFTGNTAINYGGAIYNWHGSNVSVNNSNFFNNTCVAIYTLNNLTFINNSSFDGNGGVLGIGFNNSIIDLNSYLLSNNTIINNDIVLLVNGSGNNISNGSIIGNNNSRGIFVNGHNNTFSNITIANLKVGLTFNTTNSGNILTNATISGNEIGILILGSNDTVMSSTIINNTIVGINITGNNNIVQYNRVYNNTLGLNNSGTYTNVNFNWWGLNNITTQYTNSGADFNLTYWYVLELSLNNTFYTTANDTRNYSKNQSANLSYNLSLNIPVTNTPNLLPYFEVTILIKNSTSIVNNLTGDIRNTSLSQSVAINNPNTQYSINALSDRENLILTIVGEVANYTVNVNVLKVANVSGDIHVGDNVTYTITVTNNEILNNATGVFVEDIINYNKVQYLNSNANKGIYNYGTGIWDIGTLEAGETVTLTVNVTITGTGILNNTAIVATDENNTSNNTTSTVILNITDVDISIVKIANTTGTVRIGDNITYIITVTNNGESTGTGIYVTDMLDSNKVKFISAIASIGTYNNTTGNWTIGNLLPGQSVILTINVTIIGNNSVTNTANLTTDQKNINNQNESTITTNISDNVNITVIKVSNTTGTANIGDTIKYTITITNKGLTNATGIFVTDKLNTSMLSFVSSNGSYDNNTGIWTIGNLNTGETAVLTIIATIIGNGTLVNIANVTVDQNNTDVNNGTGNATVNVTNYVNVSVVKVSNTTGTVNIGDNVAYTITVTNYGSSNATGVFVTDKLNSNMLSFVGSSSNRGSYNNNTGIWTIGNLNAGGSAVLTIIATIIGNGTIVNIANVTVDQNNTDINNSTGNSTIDVTNYVNVSVVKVSNTTGTVNIGDNITYTITVTNYGSSNATGVLVTDKLNSAMLSFVGSSANRGSYNNNTGIWTIGNLNAGESAVLSIIATIIGNRTIVNIANVTVDQNNTDTRNGTGNATVNVTNYVNVSVVKVSNTTGMANIGDNITYTITVTNYGSSNATGVLVTDKLNSAMLSFVGSSANRGYYDNNTGVWTIGNLNAGESAVLSIIATIIGNGTLVNVANVAVDQNSTGAGNGTSNSTVIVTNYVNVSVVKVSNATGMVNIGDNIVYTITVTNYGSSNATGVLVTDKLNSAMLSFVGSSADRGSYNSNTGIWTIGGLGAGETATLNITATIISNGTLLNIANLTMDQNNTNTGNGTSNSTVIVTNYVNVSVVKVSNATGAVNIGDNITYTITVTNHGTGNATGVLVTDKLNSAMLSFVGSSADRGSYNSNTGIWTIGGLGAGETVVLNITTTIIGRGTLTNTANLIVDQNNTDNGNGTANSTINIKYDTNLSVSIPDAKVGDTVNITLNLTDSDGKPVNTTANVTVDGVLYPNVEFINGIAKVPYIITEIKNNITVNFEGNDKYNPSNDTVSVNFTKKDVNINIHVPDTKIGHNTTAIITLRDVDGKPISNASIKVILNNKVIGTFITDKNGQIHPIISANGNNILKAEFSGNNEYNFAEKIISFKGNSSNNTNNTNSTNNTNNTNNTNSTNNTNNNNTSINNSHKVVDSNVGMKKTGLPLMIIIVLIWVVSLFGLISLNKLKNKDGSKMSNVNINNNSKNSVFKIAIVISLIAILFVSVSSVSAEDVTIDTTNATGINGAVALTTATGTNHTITLNPGTYNKTTDIKNNITTSRNLTIQGNGTRDLIIIDARKLGNIFNITGLGSNITFKNLTFINSNNSSINSSNSSITIINCNFTSNDDINQGGTICNINGSFSVSDSSFSGSNTGNGGAIYNNKGNFSVTNSSFSGNNARADGGAIYNNGGNFSVSYSNFSSNNATRGGAINSIGGNFSVSYSNFSSNNARNYGGAIFTSSSSFSVCDSSFSGNKADTYGGAISNYENCTVINSSFSGNNAPKGAAIYIYSVSANCSVINSSFSGNNASNDGGAVYNSYGSFSVSNSTIFSGNNASSGGAVYNYFGSFSVSDSSFSGNNASSGGGVIYNINSNFSVSDSIFSDNKAGTYGGAISNSNGNFSVSDSIFSGNNASSGGVIYNSNSNFSVSDSSFSGNNASSSGGVIFNNNLYSSFSVSDSSFSGNNASSGGVIYNSFGNFSVSDSNFTTNNASSGGAVYNSGGFSVSNSSFSGNNATYGGAIYNSGGSFSVSNSSFTNNNAGAIYNNNSGNFSVSNSSFTNNNASAIYNNNSNFSVSNSSFNGNTASGGGAICSNVGSFNVSNSSFINNNANGQGSSGGAIYSVDGSFSVSNSSFINNNANGQYGAGGAIYTGDNFNVSNSSFNGNNAFDGGAIFTGRNFNVSNSSFSGNNATSGGAISNYDGGNVSVSNSSFTNNTASSGGAIYNYDGVTLAGGIFSVSNSSFINNNANGQYGSGGAIINYNTNRGNFSVSNSSFSGNNATYRGGVIYNVGNFSVSNSSFSGNNATIYGGAIYNYGNFSVSNSSFSGNNATYGTIYNNGNNLTVNSSVFFNNTYMAIYTLNNRTFINNNSFDGNEGVLGIGFNNSTIDLNSYLMSSNIIINNDIVFLVDGSRNNISSGSIIGNNNTRGIFVNGHNNTFSNITIANLKVGLTFNTTNSGNILTNATISGNEIGILILGSNDTVMSSTIINNTITGINITGNNNIVQYNRIYNNTLGLNNSGTNTNVNFNWWGLNNVTTQYTNNGANFNLTYWYVLELSLNNTYYTTTNNTRNYTKNQSANLTYNLSLNINITNNPSSLPYFNVTVLVKNSTDLVNNLTGDIRTTSLTETVIINDPNTEYSINALSDSEDLILTLLGQNIINYTVNVSVLKVANISGDVHVGDNVTYTITVTNHETLNNATEVFVEDTIDYNKVNFLNSSVTKGNYTYGDGTWDIGVLGPGEIVTLTVNVTIIGTGALNNTAIVATDENNTNNNTTSTVILNIIDVDISIVKTANTTGTVHIGDNIIYTINVTNIGETSGTGVYVIDNLDYNKVQYINSSTITGTYNNTTGNWTIGNLAPNQSAILTITVKIIGNSSVTNTANIITDQRNINQNESSVTLNISEDVNVSIIKVSNITNLTNYSTNISDTVEYTITVTNNGLTNATGVYVIDQLNNARLSFVSSNGNGTYDNNTGIWNIGTLNPGETVVLNIIAITTRGGGLSNVANLTTNQTNTNIGIASISFYVVYNTNISGLVSNGKVGDNVNLTLTLIDSSTNLVDTVATVIVDDIYYFNVTFVNGIAEVPYNITEVKNNITVEFEGNEDFNPSNVTVNVNFTKTNLSINLSINGSVPVGKVGDSINLTLNLTDVNGNPVSTTANLTVDGINYTDVEFIDGIAKVPYIITEVKNNLTVDFIENYKYYSTNKTVDVNFTKTPIIFNIIAPNAVVGDKILLNLTATDVNGNPVNTTADVIIDGYTYYDTEFVNGIATVPYEIDYAMNNITGEFLENNKYYGDNGTFSVNFTNSNIYWNITVPKATIGDDILITINLTDVNGTPVSTTANVTIDGVLYPDVEFYNGIAELPYYVNETKTNLTFTFSGNNEYNPLSTVVDVNFTNTTDVNLSVNAPNGKVGDTVNITLNLTDRYDIPVNTTSDVTIGDVFYSNVQFVNGIAIVPYNITSAQSNITVIFETNGVYSSASNTTNVNFTKNDVNLNVTVPAGKVGDIVNVTLNLTDVNGIPVNTTSDVTIDGKIYRDVDFVNGIAIVPYNITNASSNITVVFDGNVKYSSANDTVGVNFTKTDVNLGVSVPAGKVGDIVNVTLNLTDVNGNPVNTTANLTVGGVNYTDVDFVNGIAIISYNITDARNNITAEFDGNLKYNSANDTVGVNFTKTNVNITFNLPAGKVGDTVLLNLTLTDANGNPVNTTSDVVIDGLYYMDLKFVNGIAVIPYTINSLKNNITVDFKENYKYYGAENTSDVNFTKTNINLNATIPAAKVGDIVNITLNATDLNGTPLNTIANVTIDGVLCPVEFVNGIAIISYYVDKPLNNLTIGFVENYKYYGDNGTFNVNFTKTDVDLNVSVPKGNIGDTVNITLNLTDVDGNPVNTISNVIVDGVHYDNVEFVNGIAKVPYNVTSLKNNIIVEFSGNDKYNPVNKNVYVNFTKTDVNLSVNVPNGNIGDNINITLNLTDVKGNPLNTTANITIDGVHYNNVDFANGIAKVPYNITAVKSNISVEFSGNDKYSPLDKNIDVNFTKKTLNLDVNIPNGNVGDSINITLNLTDVKGNPVNTTANITIDGVYYNNVDFVNGIAIVPYNITKAINKIVVEFSGTDEYSFVNKSVDVNFTKKNVNIDINVLNTNVGRNTTATITVTDENGNPVTNASIKVKLNNKVLGNFITDENGQIHILIPVSKNNVLEAIFSGDNQLNSAKKLLEFKGNSSTNNTNKTNKTININVNIPSGKVGDKVKATITATDSEGNPVPNIPLKLLLNGKVIGTFITDKNGQIHPVIKVGKTNVIGIHFIGNSQFNSKVIEYKFNPSNNGNNTDNTNNTNKTNNNDNSSISHVVAGSNIAMKKTGLPLIAIIMLILGLFGSISLNKSRNKKKQEQF